MSDQHIREQLFSEVSILQGPRNSCSRDHSPRWEFYCEVDGLDPEDRLDIKLAQEWTESAIEWVQAFPPHDSPCNEKLHYLCGLLHFINESDGLAWDYFNRGSSVNPVLTSRLRAVYFEVVAITRGSVTPENYREFDALFTQAKDLALIEIQTVTIGESYLGNEKIEERCKLTKLGEMFMKDISLVEFEVPGMPQSNTQQLETTAKIVDENSQQQSLLEPETDDDDAYFFEDDAKPSGTKSIRSIEIRGKSYDLEYGSDLYNLWGWGHRIGLHLARDESPHRLSHWTFRPDISARDAMMKLSVDYRHVMDQIDSFLGFTEKQYEIFMEEQDEANFWLAMFDLKGRIEMAVETIVEAQSLAETTPEADQADGVTKPRWTKETARKVLIAVMVGNPNLSIRKLNELTGIPISTIQLNPAWPPYRDAKQKGVEITRDIFEVTADMAIDSDLSPEDAAMRHESLAAVIKDQERDAFQDRTGLPQKEV